MVISRWHTLLALLLLPCLVPALAEVTVSIDRNPVRANETFQLEFSRDRTPDQEPDFSPLEQHFLILNKGKTNTLSILGGEFRRSVKWELQLMAEQAGDFMIPAISFDDERSKPFKLTVKPSSLTEAPREQMLEMLTDSTETFVQSQVILTLRLLSATNIVAYEFGEPSVANLDVVVESLGEARQFQTQISGRPYMVLEQRYALFPQQSGRLEVDPLMAVVQLPSRSSFDPFQTGGKTRRLRSPGVAIDVKPMPAEFSGAFWLPADKLELREQWQSSLDDLVAGEPITRTLTLHAQGLTAAQLPELELPQIEGIKQYPDKPSLRNRRSGDGIRGTRQHKVALIPSKGGNFRIPEISLPWWNLQTGSIEIATIPARDLVVRAAPSPAADGESEVDSGGLGAAPAPAAEANRFWIWMSLLLACGWALSAAYWWLRTHRARLPQIPAGESSSLGAARKSLREACRDNNASAARQALLAWGQALPGLYGIDNLQQLERHFGPELHETIEGLNRHLYATGQESWNGAELWSLCQRLEKNLPRGEPSGAGLAPLNPTS